MTVSMMELKLNAIRCDVGLSTVEKINRLERLRNAASALRLAAGGRVIALEYGWCDEVHLVELELAGLSH